MRGHMFKRIGAIVGFALLMLEISGCGSHLDVPTASENRARLPVEITTYNSNNKLETESFDKVPSRVVAVWQGPIETLIALGQGNRIIAATGIPAPEYLKEEYRDAYDQIPYTSFNTIPREEALLLKPDFIVTSWGSAFSNKSLGVTSFWQERGVKTYIQEIPPAIGGKRTVEDEYKFIEDMGTIFDTKAKADEIVNSMKTAIDSVQRKAESQGLNPSVMIVQFMGNRIMNWGDDYLQADIVKRLNGRILVHQKGYIGKEELIANDPDVIFLMVNEWDYNHEEESRTRFMKDVSLNGLRAIRENRVYLLPLNEGQYSAVRTRDGVERIAKGLYPEMNR